MYYERVTKATVESVLQFIKDAAELNECAKFNGFGMAEGQAASQDVALVLSATGDITTSTAKEIVKGVRIRNDICHAQNGVELTQYEADTFSKVSKEAIKVIEKHKTEGVLTRL